MTTQIKAGVIAANAITASELASSALSGGSFTGDVTFDTDTLVVDSTNNRIGIGVASPNRKVSIFDTTDGYNLELRQTSAYSSGNQSGVVFSTIYDSSNNATDVASIRGGKENTTDGNYAGNLSFYTRANGGSDTVRMKIDSSGNVGIGRSDPQQLLEVHKSTGGDQTVAKFSAHNYGDTGKTFIEIGTEYGDGSSRIGSFNNTGNSSVLVFDIHSATSGQFTEGMRIDSSGNLSVGGADSNDASFSLTADTGNWVFTNVRSNRNLEISDSDGTGTVLTIDTSGNVGIPQGKLSISGSNTPSQPIVDITATGTGTWQRGVRLLNSGMSSGDSIMYALGRSDNNKNMGQTYFYYYGDASTSNRISMGLHSVDDVFNILGTGNVGIGTTDPSEKLHVVGEARIQVPGNTSYYSDRTYLGDTYNFATNEPSNNVTFTIAGGNFSTSSAGGDFIFSTNMAAATPTEKVRIRRDGMLIHRPTHIGSLQNGDVGTYVGASGLSGTQRYTFYITGDNTWRVLFNDLRDTSGFFYVTLGDAASKDTASYTYNITSVPYGVTMFSNLTYTDGGWNTGIFEFRLTGNSPSYNLEVRFSSYYSSSNTATGHILFERLY